MGALFYVLYYGPKRNRQSRWVPAVVTNVFGTRSVNVHVTLRGQKWRRHIDQLRLRYWVEEPAVLVEASTLPTLHRDNKYKQEDMIICDRERGQTQAYHRWLMISMDQTIPDARNCFDRRGKHRFATSLRASLSRLGGVMEGTLTIVELEVHRSVLQCSNHQGFTEARVKHARREARGWQLVYDSHAESQSDSLPTKAAEARLTTRSEQSPCMTITFVLLHIRSWR